MIESKILESLGIKEFNELQKKSDITISNENEVFIISPTGSGKTIAFLLPILRLLEKDLNIVQCLILVPTRELAIQIEEVWKKMATGFKINTCYGGHDMQIEIQNLSNPPALLVGTPGRIEDHLNRRTFEPLGIKTIVFDEFDKSLSMGFEEQMENILKKLKRINKKVLVSATTAIKVPQFVNVENPIVIDFTKQNEDLIPKLSFFQVKAEEKDKLSSLKKLLQTLGPASTLIFCNHRDAVERTSSYLLEHGIESSFFHGGLEQLDREKALIQFRNKTNNFLITTDLAGRGLDISGVKNIIHYHLPLKEEEYTHRNGRTARMNEEGNVFVLYHQDENLPRFFEKNYTNFSIEPINNRSLNSNWVTLYISGGKKNKLNKIDIVGFLSKVGGLKNEEIGLIHVLDFMSFVAIEKSKADKTLKIITSEKIKGKKYKIEKIRVKSFEL